MVAEHCLRCKVIEVILRLQQSKKYVCLRMGFDYFDFRIFACTAMIRFTQMWKQNAQADMLVCVLEI
jgi:hypothetical protein